MAVQSFDYFLRDTQNYLDQKQGENFVSRVPCAIAALVVSAVELVWAGLNLVGAILAGILPSCCSEEGSAKTLLKNGGGHAIKGFVLGGRAVLNICTLGLFESIIYHFKKMSFVS